MNTKRGAKFIQEGEYAAAVGIEWIEADAGWGPYLSLADAQKLDEVRAALRRGDFKGAAQHGQVYHLTPLSV